MSESSTRQVICEFARGGQTITIAVDRGVPQRAPCRIVDVEFCDDRKAKTLGFKLIPQDARKIGMRLIEAADQAGGAK